MPAPAPSELRILFLEDSPEDEVLVRRAVSRGGIAAIWKRVETGADFEAGLAEFEPSIILADFKLPGFDGASALALARARRPEVPVIVVSGTVGEERAVEMLKQGATDFVLKDRLGRLVPAVHRALEEVQQRRAREQAEGELRRLNEELEQRIADRTRELQTKNAMMEEDLQLARELQLALLPQQFPTIPRGARSIESAVRFCSMYHPTRALGGDFFDVVRVSDTAVGVLICDVMGHGVRAALVTAMMRGLEEQLSDDLADPGRLLTAINRALHGILRQSGTDLFATAVYVVADLAHARLQFASGGHPSPLVVRSERGEVAPLLAGRSGGPALALFEDATYATHECPLHARDVVLFFTDGLFEVENAAAETFSEQRLREAIRRRADLPSGEMLREVFAEVERFADGRPFADDVCFLGMEIADLPAESARLGHRVAQVA